jgi:hypothetical protein
MRSHEMARSVLSTRAMNKKLAGIIAATAVGVAGCASHDDGSTDPEAPPNADEIAAGNKWSGNEADDAQQAPDPNEPVAAITTPDEDANPYLDAPDTPGTLVDDEGVAIDPSELTETKTCRRATGYRSGRAFTICVTTIDGKPVEVNTARAFVRMRAAAKRHGVYIHVVSGFRTMAQQRYLYHLYLIGKGNLAAPPGYSNHQSGHALDLNTSAPGVYSYLARHGAAYSFRRTVPSEAWHWEHW